VEVTGPWGHAGAYTTLENMVRHTLIPAQAIANYDFSQLDATANLQVSNILTNTQLALEQVQANRTNNVSGVHQNVEFSEDDANDLVVFLKTLTDPCVKGRSCLVPRIPHSMGSVPDGLKLNAIDSTGALL
jgi:cytochrome c peroxidase